MSQLKSAWTVLDRFFLHVERFRSDNASVRWPVACVATRLPTGPLYIQPGEIPMMFAAWPDFSYQSTCAKLLSLLSYQLQLQLHYGLPATLRLHWLHGTLAHCDMSYPALLVA